MIYKREEKWDLHFILAMYFFTSPMYWETGTKITKLVVITLQLF